MFCPRSVSNGNAIKNETPKWCCDVLPVTSICDERFARLLRVFGHVSFLCDLSSLALSLLTLWDSNRVHM